MKIGLISIISLLFNLSVFSQNSCSQKYENAKYALMTIINGNSSVSAQEALTNSLVTLSSCSEFNQFQKFMDEQLAKLDDQTVKKTNNETNLINSAPNKSNLELLNNSKEKDRHTIENTIKLKDSPFYYKFENQYKKYADRPKRHSNIYEHNLACSGGSVGDGCYCTDTNCNMPLPFGTYKILFTLKSENEEIYKSDGYKAYINKFPRYTGEEDVDEKGNIVKKSNNISKNYNQNFEINPSNIEDKNRSLEVSNYKTTKYLIPETKISFNRGEYNIQNKKPSNAISFKHPEKKTARDIFNDAENARDKIQETIEYLELIDNLMQNFNAENILALLNNLRGSVSLNLMASYYFSLNEPYHLGFARAIDLFNENNGKVEKEFDQIDKRIDQINDYADIVIKNTKFSESRMKTGPLSYMAFIQSKYKNKNFKDLHESVIKVSNNVKTNIKKLDEILVIMVRANERIKKTKEDFENKHEKHLKNKGIANVTMAQLNLLYRLGFSNIREYNDTIDKRISDLLENRNKWANWVDASFKKEENYLKN